MYNIINLKFTVIASCGANIVILSSKQYLIHRRLKTTTRGAWFWKKKKIKQQENHKKKRHKNTRCSQLVAVHFWRALTWINWWRAVKGPLFKALLFLVVTPWPWASAEMEGWSIDRRSRITTESNQELIYSLNLLYVVQNKTAVTAEWPYIHWLTRWRELLTYVSPEPSPPSDGCLVKSNKGLCVVFGAQT